MRQWQTGMLQCQSQSDNNDDYDREKTENVVMLKPRGDPTIYRSKQAIDKQILSSKHALGEPVM